MDDELLEILDDNGKVVGTLKRSETERLNHTIKNALVFIFNSKGEVWIQKRAKTKKHFPGIWDISACGAIASGEEPEVAAKREMLEETGIMADLVFVEKFMHKLPGGNGETHTRLSHLYVAMSEDIPKINDEVEEFKAVEYKQLEKDIKADPASYIPSFLIELEKAAAVYEELNT